MGCESGCLCALAPHGAGDCLPRYDPQSIAFFPIGQAQFGCVVGSEFGLRPFHCGGIHWPVELHFSARIHDPEDL